MSLSLIELQLERWDLVDEIQKLAGLNQRLDMADPAESLLIKRNASKIDTLERKLSRIDSLIAEREQAEMNRVLDRDTSALQRVAASLLQMPPTESGTRIRRGHLTLVHSKGTGK